MSQPLICLTLTGKTLKEDVEIIEKYREYIDVVELRADFLNDDERLRKFPAMSSVPCILTIRRRVDGGQFIEGEANRSVLLQRHFLSLIRILHAILHTLILKKISTFPVCRMRPQLMGSGSYAAYMT